MPDDLRLFVALELPDPILAALDDVQRTLQGKMPTRTVRWVRGEGIHLTLKFLGETPAVQREAITAALAAACAGYPPLTLRAAGLGCFPTSQRPRVIWVGLEGDLERLAALQRAVESALEPLGFRPEGRAFNPHLTLGRLKDASSADVKVVGSVIEGTALGTVGTWTASAVSLMRSELRPDGARYTCLAHVALEESTNS
jgi:2'-5' RNA ligase